MWRQSPCVQATEKICIVAICTERVEAKIEQFICDLPYDIVAICTERVEAKYDITRAFFRLFRCNLHGACGGKGERNRVCYIPIRLQSARSVWRQSALPSASDESAVVAICTERVEAKCPSPTPFPSHTPLQSARSVWRQRSPAGGVGVLCSCCNLHGACGGKAVVRRSFSCPFRLQSARSVWRQSSVSVTLAAYSRALQSARSVWRQSSSKFTKVRQGANVAICTERVEAKVRRFAYAHLCRVAICTERVEAKCGFKRPQRRLTCCNLHGACGGKVANPS